MPSLGTRDGLHLLVRRLFANATAVSFDEGKQSCGVVTALPYLRNYRCMRRYAGSFRKLVFRSLFCGKCFGVHGVEVSGRDYKWCARMGKAFKLKHQAAFVTQPGAADLCLKNATQV